MTEHYNNNIRLSSTLPPRTELNQHPSNAVSTKLIYTSLKVKIYYTVLEFL